VPKGTSGENSRFWRVEGVRFSRVAAGSPQVGVRRDCKSRLARRRPTGDCHPTAFGELSPQNGACVPRLSSVPCTRAGFRHSFAEFAGPPVR
jgi:hypothetical protein